ncbi:MAG: CSLREA domain-containing protein [Anaerolineales bacterium]
MRPCISPRQVLGVISLVAAASWACTLTDLFESADLPTLVVTKTEDTNDGVCSRRDCSLREAVVAANADAEADVISVPAGTYLLTRNGSYEDAADTGDLDLTAEVKIIGVASSGSGATVIVAAFTDAGDRLFDLHTGPIELRALRLEGGRAVRGGGVRLVPAASALLDDVGMQDHQASETHGGAILNEGTLTLENSRLGDSIAPLGGAISNTGTLTVRATTIENSGADQGGGGIANTGSLTIEDSIFSGLSAGTGRNGEGLQAISPGGAIRSSGGPLIIRGSEFQDNESSFFGGAIDHQGVAEIRDTEIDGNRAPQGGGISLGGSGASTLSGLSIHDNEAMAGDGGGLFLGDSTIVEMTDSTIAHNSAEQGRGGGVNSLADLTVERTRFEGNTAGEAGGMYSYGVLIASDSTLTGNQATIGQGGGLVMIYRGTLLGLTFNGNTAATRGGGLHLQGEITLGNCTLSENEAAQGGGISIGVGIIYLRHCTIAGNSAPEGSGMYASSFAQVSNTIWAWNLGSPNCQLATGFGGGANLDTDGSCGYVAPNSLVGVDPLLGPLQDNGGPTWTRALGPGSPAIDTASPTQCLAADQRGVPRPLPFCDIGAYEVEAGVVLTPQPLPTTAVAPFAPIVIGLVDTACRSGPDRAYEVTRYLHEGETAPASARNESTTWVEVQLPNAPLCWVFLDDVSFEGDPHDLPAKTVAAPTATRTPTRTPTPTPTFSIIVSVVPFPSSTPIP